MRGKTCARQHGRQPLLHCQAHLLLPLFIFLLNGKIKRSCQSNPRLDQNGVPENYNTTIILAFSNNGTYKISTSLVDGSMVPPTTGKFQLLEDDILVMTNDGDSKSYNSIISKLTKTSVHFKSQFGKSIYTLNGIN